MTFAVVITRSAARQIQRERAWLHNNLGPHRADAFEAELAHALDLLAEHPNMGNAAPDDEGERHWFLRRSRFHVYYLVHPEREALAVVRIRHERQQPPR